MNVALRALLQISVLQIVGYGIYLVELNRVEEEEEEEKRREKGDGESGEEWKMEDNRRESRVKLLFHLDVFLLFFIEVKKFESNC